MRKLVIEIPLAKHVRADELGRQAQALLFVVRRALATTIPIPDGPFLVGNVSIRAESEPAPRR
jgi:hypothetical protein